MSKETVATPPGDVISHHLPVRNHHYNVKDGKVIDAKAEAAPVILPKPDGKRPRSSRPMSRDRKVAAGFIALGHVFALWGAIMIAQLPTWNERIKWTVAVLLAYFFTGTMGITAGVHRLWAHRTYKANFFVRLFFALMNTISNQSSILAWSVDHRVHHQYVDTEADPHNINEGFWHAHMLWLFRPRSDAYVQARKRIDTTDLLADPIVYYQDKYYFFLGPFCCYILPAIIGWYFTNRFWMSFLVFGNLRWVITLHATWTVNSVAHMYGTRPYKPEILPTENGWVSFFSGGEGWHNWHHAFPWDYRATADCLFGRWNAARLYIDFFALFGWVWDRKVQRNVVKLPEFAPGEAPY